MQGLKEQDVPRYHIPPEPYFKDLRREVQQLVRQRDINQNRLKKIKLVLFPSLYVLTYFSLLLWGSKPIIFFGTYFLLGVLIVVNFLNLIHDAVHGVAIPKKSKWNHYFIYLFDLLGANSYIWKIRHIQLHHSFPNVQNWDSDFEQSPLVRVFPQSEARKIHRFQHIYLPFLYPFYLLNWLLVRDFKDFFQKDRIVNKVAEIPETEVYKLIFFKLFFFTYLLLIPKMVLGVTWSAILGGFLLMLFTASIISLLVLLSPHANVESTFPQTNEKGELPNSWFMHQLLCTNDVSNDNFFIRFFMGSFNYHIAHHLFPHVHHSLYPEITGIIKKYCHDHHLPYREQSLWQSLKNHYLLLKKNAVQEDIFEETM